jgi:predicted NBD/HSP70 family sugar kinase
LASLERALRAAGHDSGAIQRSPTVWPGFEPVLEQWLDEGSRCLANAIASIGVFVDFRTTIIGGRLPAPTLKALCESTQRYLAEIDIPAEKIPRIRAAEIGAYGKAIGAASLPFSAKFMVDQFGLAPA